MNYSDEIKYMAENGFVPMTEYPTSRRLWDELALVPAQLSHFPLFSPEEADVSVTIGKNALIPMNLSMPVIVSHMCFGALKRYEKIGIARAVCAAGTANGGGDGGVVADEAELSSAYIYEYTPGLYGLSPEILDECGAVEIKIGQGSGGGVALEIPPDADAKIYELRGGEKSPFFASPARFSDISSTRDLALLVEGIREGCGGKPVGIKLAAGNIEADLAVVLEARADFVTIDGGGGGWRVSSCLEGGGVPALYALRRAKKFLADKENAPDIIITGGIATPADAAKTLALGADAVGVAGAVRAAICGAADENETFRRALNYLKAMGSGLKTICAYTGRQSVSELCLDDVVTLNGDVALYTDINHA